MPRRTIDVVAAGPAHDDPYDPAAPAWALAVGLAARGHAVQVVHPTSGPEGPRPAIPSVAFSPLTPHVGSWEGEAELAHQAGRHLRPEADAVVRDPSGLGPIRHGHRPRAVVAVVRSLAADHLAGRGPEGRVGGLRARLALWGERRAVVRLERAALAEATAVVCDPPSLAEPLRSRYGVEPTRLRSIPTAVGGTGPAPSREDARRALGLPTDVPVATLLAPPGADDPGAVTEVLDAFRRTRPIFTGARLVVRGATAPTGGGISVSPGEDLAGLELALAAADVAIVLPRGGEFDPGPVLALRSGAAVIASPSASLPEGADAAVRRVPARDGGGMASVLAELFADPAERRKLADRGRAVAAPFDPGHVAEALEASGALEGG